MPDEKYVVPEGMRVAAVKAMKAASETGGHFRSTEQWVDVGLAAALQHLSENPMVPDDDQARDVLLQVKGYSHLETTICFSTEWQRRMFLAMKPDPKRAKVLQVVQDIGRLSGMSSTNCEQWTDVLMDALKED